MSSCLGIYVDRNLIKYAKLKKYKGSYKIEAFNVEVFDDLEIALSKVIADTNSSKTPIAINISDELYNYFDVFSALEKKDITKSLDIEFEMLCSEKGYDKKSLESRYILRDNSEDPDKYKAIYISSNKKELDKQIKLLEKYRLFSMAPVSTSITNLIDDDEEENIAIINLENETKLTTIIDGQISRIDILNTGLQDIVDKINTKELSWKKAYNIFKNITIYKQEAKSIDDTENEYIEYVMPKINKICDETKKLLASFNERVDRIYISGMGATISNIDLYFQEYFGIKCQILKPYFIDPDNLRVPTKEYIEVNSAISLALDGLGYINKDLNFAPVSKIDNIEIENIKSAKDEFDIKDWREYFKDPLSIQEKILCRAIAAMVITIVAFGVIGGSITSKNNSQKDKISKTLAKSTEEINVMDKQLKEIKTYTDTYKSLVDSADELNEVTSSTENSRVISKNAVPNLLNKIMFIIPQKVQISSIKNTESNHVVIVAVSEKYEQLGYFLAAIKNDAMLKNIQSTSGTKSDSLVEITIEGDLP